MSMQWWMLFITKGWNGKWSKMSALGSNPWLGPILSSAETSETCVYPHPHVSLKLSLQLLTLCCMQHTLKSDTATLPSNFLFHLCGPCCFSWVNLSHRTCSIIHPQSTTLNASKCHLLYSDMTDSTLGFVMTTWHFIFIFTNHEFYWVNICRDIVRIILAFYLPINTCSYACEALCEACGFILSGAP